MQETVGETSLRGTIDGKGPFAAHYRVTSEQDGTQRWCVLLRSCKSMNFGSFCNLCFD